MIVAARSPATACSAHGFGIRPLPAGDDRGQHAHRLDGVRMARGLVSAELCPLLRRAGDPQQATGRDFVQERKTEQHQGRGCADRSPSAG